VAQKKPEGAVGARPAGPPPKKRGPAAWLISVVLLIVAVLLLLLVLSRCDGSDDDSRAATIATPTEPDAAASPPISSGAPSGSSDGEVGSITADGATMLPLTGSARASLSAYSGSKATATSVAVQSVPADEGFWVGSGPDDRVWVQLTVRAGESSFEVHSGQRVSFTGTVTANGPGFADQVGVTDAEGKAQLDAQGYHLFVARSSVFLTP